jgi:phytoene synthase
MMDDVADPRLGEAYVYCETLLREHDPDRWLACLFAPWSHRKHLHALYAFSLEVARVREIVSDPMPGEIRFQWWRDALEGEERGDISAHPVASALLDTVKRFKLPRAALTNLVDARTFDLYDDPMPGMRQLEGYGGETSSAIIRMACLILADGRDPGGADAAGHGGLAFAITGLLRALPWHGARGQVYLPGDVLKEAGAMPQDLIAGSAARRWSRRWPRCAPWPANIWLRLSRASGRWTPCPVRLSCRWLWWSLTSRPWRSRATTRSRR